MAGKLDGIVVAQQTSRALIVGWKFIPFGVREPASAKVKIYRSEVENTGFSLISTVPASKGWYLDDEVDILDRWMTAFYKLELIIDGVTLTYGPHRVNGTVDVQARSLISHMRKYLRLAGLPVLVYQYLDNGDRCPDCWDPILRKTTRSNCLLCFGTGYQTGYHEPVLTLAAMGVEGKSNIVNERTEQEAMIEMLFANFPVLRPGDIIYEIDAGKRYRVKQSLPVEKHRMLINQSALGYGLQPTDVENNIPIPDISKLDPVLKRVYATHRKVSSSDGESFDYSPFDKIKY